MVEALAEYCKKNNVLFKDVPNFVDCILSAPVPFGRTSKLAKTYNYASENGLNKKTIDDLPESIKKVLYSFQKEGVKYGLEKYGRMLLGDEMGVGKTIQAICIAYLYKNDWPMLIVTPASLKFTWRDEILKWLPSVLKDDI